MLSTTMDAGESIGNHGNTTEKTSKLSNSGMLSNQLLSGTSAYDKSDIFDVSMESQKQGSIIGEVVTTHDLELAANTTDDDGGDTISSKDESYTSDKTDNKYFSESLLEVGRRLWPSNSKAQNYTKGCQWSPDGACALVPVHLDGMHIIELPQDIHTVDFISPTRKVSELPTAVHVEEGGTVYDYCWYPFMNSCSPETCCWLASRQHEPIHMWDAYHGKLRCSYRGYDDVDEVEAAISVIFSNDGDKIYAGYKKSIKIFDTKIPGRDCSSIPVKQAVSCIALNFSNNFTLTTGSWNSTIKHYDLRTPNLFPLFTLMGHKGGITWLRYAPGTSNNWMLFSGARKDDKILQWDMRNYTKPVREFKRNVETNQRIYFELSPQCEWLVSGDTQGLLRVWNLFNEEITLEVQLHMDCCNGISFNPMIPVLATTAGQYHFLSSTVIEGNPTSEKIVNYENSLLFLWLGKLQNDD